MPVRIATVVTVLALSGCAGSAAVDTGDGTGQRRDERTAGPNGLSQQLVAVVNPPELREPGFHTLVVTSMVTNSGSVPVPVTARVCLFTEDDLEITAEADRLEPLISCGAVTQSTTLDPGQSVGPMVVSYRLRSGPGTYSITVRHALTPELRGRATFTIP